MGFIRGRLPSRYTQYVACLCCPMLRGRGGASFKPPPRAELYICISPDEEGSLSVFLVWESFTQNNRDVRPHGISTLWPIVGSVVRSAALPPTPAPRGRSTSLLVITAKDQMFFFNLLLVLISLNLWSQPHLKVTPHLAPLGWSSVEI